MQAGRLNEIIKIWSKTTRINEYGEAVDEYDKSYITRAKVDHKSGGRSVENNEVFYSYYKTFNVRFYVPILDTDRIEYQGHLYRILSTEHRREYNEIIINTELINE